MNTEEKENFVNAAAVFDAYGANAKRDLVDNKEQRIAALAPEQQRLAMALVLPHSSRVAACIEHNAHVTAQIAASVTDLVPEVSPEDVSQAVSSLRKWDQVRIALNQLAREWSAEGTRERAESYGPVLSALAAEFPDPAGVKVVVPGCGLARLPWELASRGFDASGNENSCEMLLTQHFVLGQVASGASQTIYPYVHAVSHFRNPTDQLQPVVVPYIEDSTANNSSLDSSASSNNTHGGDDNGAVSTDEPDQPHKLHNANSDALDVSDNAGNAIDNAGLGTGKRGGREPGQMSMLCGTFNDSFDDCPAGYYDAIASVFFLDTQSNIFETVEVVTRIVRPGGLWINFGPLHWHFERVGPLDSDEGGLELTVSGLIKLIEMHGWRLETHTSHNRATYCATNPKRMSPYAYDCEFWVARKVK